MLTIIGGLRCRETAAMSNTTVVGPWTNFALPEILYRARNLTHLFHSPSGDRMQSVPATELLAYLASSDPQSWNWKATHCQRLWSVSLKYQVFEGCMYFYMLVNVRLVRTAEDSFFQLCGVLQLLDVKYYSYSTSSSTMWSLFQPEQEEPEHASHPVMWEWLHMAILYQVMQSECPRYVSVALRQHYE